MPRLQTSVGWSGNRAARMAAVSSPAESEPAAMAWGDSAAINRMAVKVDSSAAVGKMEPPETDSVSSIS